MVMSRVCPRQRREGLSLEMAFELRLRGCEIPCGELGTGMQGVETRSVDTGEEEQKLASNPREPWARR